MRILTPLVLVLAVLLTAGTSIASSADDKIRVVATLPDLADLAREIGGDRVDVKALARPGQNLHAVRVKPSHLVALSKADLFLQVGLSLEHAWVPGLLQTARNRDVLPGMKGFVSAGEIPRARRSIARGSKPGASATTKRAPAGTSSERPSLPRGSRPASTTRSSTTSSVKWASVSPRSSSHAPAWRRRRPTWLASSRQSKRSGFL